MAERERPSLIKSIPDQILSEGSVFRHINLIDFIESPDASGNVYFTAELSDGRALPRGLICTSEGLLTGIAASDTKGTYEVVIAAENDVGIFKTKFNLTIKERISMKEADQYFTDLKSKVWEALGDNLPLPDMQDFLDRPITAEEIYYLQQRYAYLLIWDVYNLDPPGECIPLKLEGSSPHYEVYDRGSCLVAAPKDLYSYERTIEDALVTAKAMAREVYNRGWTIEFTGFDKMARACWVELQILAEKQQKPIEVVHYTPSPRDILLYHSESTAESIFGKKR